MHPIEQLLKDREAARGNGDPCANLCTAATVDDHNRPHARTLVLREVGPRIALFVNQTSPKWQQIADAGVTCVVVWLPSLQIQYRLQCHVQPVPKHLVDESWLMRPDTPKQLDWYYTTQQAQSSVVTDRDTLLKHIATFNQPEHTLAPPTATGWYLQPFHVDRLDLNHSSGVHDRRAFSLIDGIWEETVLVP